MALSIARANPAQLKELVQLLKELVQLLVERVESREGRVVPVSVVWSGPARPFLDAVVMAPPDGLGGTGTNGRCARLVRDFRLIGSGSIPMRACLPPRPRMLSDSPPSIG
jgi:hypothetical protein